MSARSTSKSRRARRRRLAEDSSAILAHVPVDRFEIIDGPGSLRWNDIGCVLVIIEYRVRTSKNDIYPYVDQEFTLLTTASQTPFGRKLQLAHIYVEHDDGSCSFTALFANKIVSGWYNPKTRKGWFSLD